jgi:hypothetical protein
MQTRRARSFWLTVMAFRSVEEKLLAVEQNFWSIVLTATMSSLLMIVWMGLLTLLVGGRCGPPLTNSHNRPAA